MISARRLVLSAFLIATTVGISAAQFGGAGDLGGDSGGAVPGNVGGRGARGGRQGGGGGGGGRCNGGGEFMTGNEPIQPIPRDRLGVPEWKIDPAFKNDTFTFARLRFTSQRTTSGRGGTGTSWLNDWPHSDLNISFRLQQMTAMKVNPNPVQLEITDPRLPDYPFAFMVQVGAMRLTGTQILTLRRYLLNGGFLMVDDHWGVNDQRNFADQMRLVFPDRRLIDMDISHPLFHCVFDLKELPQVATIQGWRPGQPSRRSPDDPDPHYRAIYDDRGRMMVLECANTDTPDGWEREGDDEEYFHTFSEKMAYPLMINILFYSMTH